MGGARGGAITGAAVVLGYIYPSVGARHRQQWVIAMSPGIPCFFIEPSRVNTNHCCLPLNTIVLAILIAGTSSDLTNHGLRTAT